MTITGNQVVAARGLLRISQDVLVEKAGVGKATLVRFEREETDPRTEIREKIKSALEKLGIEFTNGGVIPRRSIVEEIFGIDAYDLLEDEMWDKVKDNKNEIMLFGIDEAFATQNNINHSKRMRENNVPQRNITRVGAKTFMFPKDTYRFLGEDLFNFTPFAVYVNNLALVYPDTKSKIDHIIIVRNEHFAETFTKLFNHLWKFGKKE